MVESVHRERIGVFVDLVHRVEEEPFDEGVQPAFAFKNVQNVMIPAVFADQAEPFVGSGRGRFIGGESLIRCVVDDQSIVVGLGDGVAKGDKRAVDDEGLAVAFHRGPKFQEVAAPNRHQ